MTDLFCSVDTCRAEPSPVQVVYDPPAFGDIIPVEECRHNPAGHLFQLGLQIVDAPRGRGGIQTDGWICLKCGSGSHNHADDWWDLWCEAVVELGPKSWKLQVRLEQLAMAAVDDNMLAIFKLLERRREAVEQ